MEHMLNTLVHTDAFQKLEAAWRGLFHVICFQHAESLELVKIKILNISWSVLMQDVLNQERIEQTELFELICEQEYNHPGGEPYNLCIGDFLIDSRNNTHLRVVRRLRRIAACALTTLIMPLKTDHLDRGDWKNIQRQTLSQDKNTPFVAFICPKLLCRPPYQSLEKVQCVEDYLWGNPCYEYAVYVMSLFIQNGWLKHDNLLTPHLLFRPLRYDYFPLDSCGVINRKSIVKQHYTHEEINTLNTIGCIVLHERAFDKQVMSYHDALKCTNQSFVHQHNRLQFVIRFLHCLKVMFRNKIGSIQDITAYENYLQQWLFHYCSSVHISEKNLQSQYLLKYARIRMRELGTQTGYYIAIDIQPRDQVKNKYDFFHFESQFTIRQ
jgi:type VI secretion system protein ImpD